MLPFLERMLELNFAAAGPAVQAGSRELAQQHVAVIQAALAAANTYAGGRAGGRAGQQAERSAGLMQPAALLCPLAESGRVASVFSAFLVAF